MEKIKRSDLYSLEQYAEMRNDMRTQIMQHKKSRAVYLGNHLSLYFEDRRTVQYQIQEMLRIEKIFESDAIEDELSAYNPLIPDGSNWKATMMIEYPIREERVQWLAKLIGIDRLVYVQVGQNKKVYPISNEDLEREAPDKTSAVHFLRFELSKQMILEVKENAPIIAGVEHKHYQMKQVLTPEVCASLAQDLDS